MCVDVSAKWIEDVYIPVNISALQVDTIKAKYTGVIESNLKSKTGYSSWMEIIEDIKQTANLSNTPPRKIAPAT